MVKFHPVLLALVLALTLTAVRPVAAQSRIPEDLKEAIQHVDEFAANGFDKDKVGSVTVGVVSGGELVWTKSYGLADMEKRVPATRDTVYRIGSITKQFTALMLLQLVQDGTVKLSDPVEKYLPDVNKIQGRPPNAPPITLVELATMTSGLASEPKDLATYLKGPVSEWENVLLSALPQASYAHEPDTHYLYANIGYAILGAAISRAAGLPYVRYVQEKILGPLEMTHSSFEATATVRPHLSKGYQVDRTGKVDATVPKREHDGRGYKVPNGAMYTTVDDLSRFVSFELGHGPAGLLKKEVQDDNYSRVNSANADLTLGYGVGFMLVRKGDNIYVGHYGSVAGYRADAWVNRGNQTAVIALRNVNGGKFDIADFCFQALGELAKARPRTTPPASGYPR